MTAAAARAAGFAVALLLALASAAQEQAPEVPAGDATLVGRVSHPERPEAASGVDVILYSLTAEGDPGLRRTTADAEGGFTFDGISADPSMVYLVGTRVSGVPFGARVSFAAGETRREVVIEASEPSQQASDVRLLEPSLRLERGCSHLRLRHQHPLRNDSGRVVFVPPEAREGATPLFELLLPEGASEIETLLGTSGEGFEREGRRLRYWGPLYPGASGVEFAYGVASAPELSLELGFPTGVEGLRVLTPLAGARVSGATLRDAGETVLPSGGHRAFAAEAIGPGDVLRFSVALDEAPGVDALELAEARLWLELDDATLSVSELFLLNVAGRAALESPSDAPLLCLELPDDASELRFSDASLDMGLSRDPGGALALYGPVPPGESSLSLRYQLPARPGAVTFARRFSSEVSLLTLLVADTGLVPEAERLHNRRPVRTEDRSYLHLEAFGVGADEEVSVVLTPLPQRRGLPAFASTGFVLLAGLAALLFLVAPLRDERAPVSEPDQAISTERQALYQAIEALDEDFETGKLSDEDHGRMRGELRARAVALLREERSAASEGQAGSGEVDDGCGKCGAPARAADRFCAQCGAPLGNVDA